MKRLDRLRCVWQNLCHLDKCQRFIQTRCGVQFGEEIQQVKNYMISHKQLLVSFDHSRKVCFHCLCLIEDPVHLCRNLFWRRRKKGAKYQSCDSDHLVSVVVMTTRAAIYTILWLGRKHQVIIIILLYNHTHIIVIIIGHYIRFRSKHFQFQSYFLKAKWYIYIYI